MPKVAIRVIAVVYGVTLFLVYIHQHPPAWVDNVSLVAEGTRSITMFGHTIRLNIAVSREAPVGPQAAIPVQGLAPSNIRCIRFARPVVNAVGQLIWLPKTTPQSRSSGSEW